MRAEDHLEKDDPRYLTSVERGFQVLETFSSSLGPLSLTDLKTATGLSIPTLQRLTTTLVEAGYLTKEPVSRRYQLTIRTIDLLYSYLSRNHFANSSWPHLVSLREELRRDVSLSVPQGHAMIYVHRLPGYRGNFENTLPGKQVPMHLSASGRCYMAAMSPAQLDAYFVDWTPVQLTNKSLNNKGEILEQITRCREQGYCIINQEVTTGVVTMACPVSRGGATRAGVSVHVPFAGMEPDALVETVLPTLATVAKAISLT